MDLAPGSVLAGHIHDIADRYDLAPVIDAERPFELYRKVLRNEGVEILNTSLRSPQERAYGDSISACAYHLARAIDGDRLGLTCAGKRAEIGHSLGAAPEKSATSIRPDRGADDFTLIVDGVGHRTRVVREDAEVLRASPARP